MSTAELAGNYVTSGGGAEDPGYVAEKLAEMQEEAAAEKAEVVEHQSAQAEVLHGDDPDSVTLAVAGETMAADPLGLGRRARLMRRAQQADERGDEMAQIEAVLGMIDALDDATPTTFDQTWWDDRSEDQIRSAFQQLARQSAGGNA